MEMWLAMGSKGEARKGAWLKWDNGYAGSRHELIRLAISCAPNKSTKHGKNSSIMWVGEDAQTID